MYHTVIHSASIPVTTYIEQYRDAEKFIRFCKECNRYDRCWACPPFDFDTTEYLIGYDNAYIIGIKIILDDETRQQPDMETSKIIARQIIEEVRAKVDKRLLTLEKSYPGSKSFFAGTCINCPPETCTRIKGAPCIHPDKIRYSLEAMGFDIEKTASELLQTELKWSTTPLLPEYFTLVSGFFTNYKIDDFSSEIDFQTSRL